MPAPISSDRRLKESLQAYLLTKTGYGWTYASPDSDTPVGFVNFYRGDRRADQILDKPYIVDLRIELRVSIVDFNLDAIDSRILDEIGAVSEAVRSLALNGLVQTGSKTPTVFKGIKLEHWEKRIEPEAIGDQRKTEDTKYRASGYLYCGLLS